MRSATSSAHSSERRNAPAKPRHSSARSACRSFVRKRRDRLLIRSAVAGALPCLARPVMVKRRAGNYGAKRPRCWLGVRGRPSRTVGRWPRPCGRWCWPTAAVGEAGEGWAATMPWCAGRAVAPLEAHPRAAKSRQVRGVGRPGRQRLLCGRVAHGGVLSAVVAGTRQLLGYDEGKMDSWCAEFPEGQFIAHLH